MRALAPRRRNREQNALTTKDTKYTKKAIEFEFFPFVFFVSFVVKALALA